MVLGVVGGQHRHHGALHQPGVDQQLGVAHPVSTVLIGRPVQQQHLGALAVEGGQRVERAVQGQEQWWRRETLGAGAAGQQRRVRSAPHLASRLPYRSAPGFAHWMLMPMLLSPPWFCPLEIKYSKPRQPAGK